MMIAFSVASETRSLKHAYAMVARDRIATLLLIGMLLALSASEARMDDDEYLDNVETEIPTEATTELSPETTTETSSEAPVESSSQKRLVPAKSLNSICKMEKEKSARCKGFNFDDPQDVAFIELPMQVRIGPGGATYELGHGTLQVEVLVIENSTFVNFPLHLFYELPRLSEVDMRRCGIQSLTWECFLIADRLKILLLSGNAITELNERTFSYASELGFLFLDENRISRLHPFAFMGLRQLQHLDLSGNQLEELPEGLFDDLAALNQLTIADNRIRFISNTLLAKNKRLQTIILHGNQLRQLGEYAFSAAPHLLALDVSHNARLETLVLNLNAGHLMARNCSLNRVNIFGSVTNVDLGDNRLQELYFSASEALEDLVLCNNSLGQLATLGHVPRLRRLNVANNPELRDLPNDWQNPRIERLDLSNTGLLQLPQAVLRGMPQLRKLNVSANKISDIDPKDFENLSQLTHFFINANMWNCFNLRLVMDLLIMPHGITYVPDKLDDNFPGSYINGIACMYRLHEREQLEADSRQDLSAAYSSASASVESTQFAETNEVEKLRQEFKAVVQHLEQKFDSVYAQLKTLNAKLSSFEQINSTLWSQVSIVV